MAIVLAGEGKLIRCALPFSSARLGIDVPAVAPLDIVVAQAASVLKSR
jgi:hypothetical protein